MIMWERRYAPDFAAEREIDAAGNIVMHGFL
jgi:hypothetical protein